MTECSTDGISCRPQMALILNISLNRTTDFFVEHWLKHVSLSFEHAKNNSMSAIYDLDHYINTLIVAV